MAQLGVPPSPAEGDARAVFYQFSDKKKTIYLFLVTVCFHPATRRYDTKSVVIFFWVEILTKTFQIIKI